MNISKEWTAEERLAIIAALTFSDRKSAMRERKPPEYNSELLCSIAVMPPAFLEAQRAGLERLIYRVAKEQRILRLAALNYSPGDKELRIPDSDLDELSQTYGVSKDSIRQTKKRAKEKVRKYLESRIQQEGKTQSYEQRREA